MTQLAALLGCGACASVPNVVGDWERDWQVAEDEGGRFVACAVGDERVSLTPEGGMTWTSTVEVPDEDECFGGPSLSVTERRGSWSLIDGSSDDVFVLGVVFQVETTSGETAGVAIPEETFQRPGDDSWPVASGHDRTGRFLVLLGEGVFREQK